jgi:hypothetical protein
MIGCDPQVCEASAKSISEAEDGASTSAIGHATAIKESNASATNIAEADGNRFCTGTGNDEVCGPFAKAEARGDAYAEDDSDASVDNEAIADGDGASATAGRGCIVDQTGATICYGGAVALDGSDATSVNKASADGTNTTASATGAATATGGSSANQYGAAEATNGGLAVTSTDARALDGGVATSYAKGTADGFVDKNGNGIRDVTEQSSSAGVGAQTVSRGPDNITSAHSIGDATDGGQVVSSSIVVSNVDVGIFGIGVGKAVTCTPGQVSCGTAYGAALGSGSEGVVVGLTEGNATNGELVNVNVGAGAGAGCSVPGLTGSSASLVQNSDGSWSYNAHFNTGLSCVQANASADSAP